MRTKGSDLKTAELTPAAREISAFSVRYSPDLAGCLKVLERCQLNSLLDPRRILAVLELVKLAASRCDGEVIEMGVYRGGSAAAIGWMLRRAKLERVVHLFDTFGGMPPAMEHDTHEEFDFADTSTANVAESLNRVVPGFPFQFHPGLFSNTLAEVSGRRFCFAHIDADLYHSVREACEFAYPRMDRGGIILFDDYGAPSCPGAKKAVDEFFRDKLEKPTLVSDCAYAIRKGAERVDFPRLISKAVFRSSIVSAAYRAPVRIGRRTLATATRALISPRMIRTVSSLFVHHNESGRDRNRNGSVSVRDAKNILVIRQDSIGDLVLMSPFLRELRRSNSRAEIALVVDPRFLNLVELCPYVNRVLGAALSFCGATVNLGRMLEALRFSRRHLRASRFDLALIPRWDADLYHAAYLANFSGATQRVAYSEEVFASKAKVNRGFDLLLTDAIHDPTARHEVERNLDLLRFAGGLVVEKRLEVWLSDGDRETTRRMLQLSGASDGESIVALGVGAGHRRRRWPLARFVEVGRFLESKYGVRIVIVGGADDSQFGQRAMDAIPGAINLCGSLSLRQTGAVLERAVLTVANDSGPMHLAAAAGSAVVEISCHPKNADANHENSPIRFRPLTEDCVVLQPESPMPPCMNGCEQNHAHCILRVRTEDVKAAAESLLTSRLHEKRFVRSVPRAVTVVSK
jgi:ADP-heptose:LPS heptosyltransferase